MSKTSSHRTRCGSSASRHATPISAGSAGLATSESLASMGRADGDGAGADASTTGAAGSTVFFGVAPGVYDQYFDLYLPRIDVVYLSGADQDRLDRCLRE